MMNPWEGLRMPEKDSYPRRCGGSFEDGIHSTTCMIMNGNAWEWLRMAENRSYARMGSVILGWFTLNEMHENEWECVRRSHNACACMWIFFSFLWKFKYFHHKHAHGWWDRLMHSHSLSCMSSYVYQHWMTHSPPWIWVILRDSESFSCILDAYMLMHYEIV